MPRKTAHWIRKSHRWIGAAAAAWLFVLAFTGILLQHAEDWGLDKKSVRLHTLLASQGYAPETWTYSDLSTGRSTTIQAFGSTVYRLPLAQGEYLDLPEKPVAILPQNHNLWLVFPQRLWQVDKHGAIVMQLDALDGLNTPITQAFWLEPSANKEQIVLVTADNAQLFNTRSLQFSPVDAAIARKQGTVPALPVHTSGWVMAKTNLAEGILTWQKLIFSWHAGLVGTWWLNDLAAIALIFLCLSGLWLFVSKKRRR